MASEVGVLDIPRRATSCVKERLHPGRCSWSTPAQGRIIADDEIKRELARGAARTREWLQEHLIDIEDLPTAPYLPTPDHETVLRRQQAFGYTHEDLRLLLAPMAHDGEEPIGSMGTDTPLAVLSERPRLLYDYFKQLFAQVTNPPLDAIREELVTSMESTIGPEGNLLEPTPRVVPADQASSTRSSTTTSWRSCATCRPARGFRSITLPMLYRPGGGRRRRSSARWTQLLRAGERRRSRAGYTILILSDRGVDARQRADPEPAGDRRRAPPPGPRGHAHAVRAASSNPATRARCTTCALLIGYGAGAVNPYLAFETLDDMIRQRLLVEASTHEKAVQQLHQGAQQGHPQGDVEDGHLDAAELLRRADLRGDRPRPGVRRPVLHLDGVAHRRRRHRRRSPRKCAQRHARAFPSAAAGRRRARAGRRVPVAPRRRDHLFNPETVLQAAARDAQRPVRDLQGVHARSSTTRAARSARCAACSSFKPRRPPVPLDEVEPVEAILKRFATGAMSYGSISQEAHETLAIAMNRIGGKSNTGEGGEDPARYVPRRQRRLAAQRHQAGGLGALRRHQRVPGQRRRPADQDGAGRQARRGRPAARPQGLSVDRQGPALDARRRR